MNNYTPQTVEIPLTKGYAAIVDIEDADLASRKWCSLVQPTGNVYAKSARGFKGAHKTILLHRLILERIVARPLNKGEFADHINGDTLDNRRSNLRVATHAQNMRNSKIRRNNTSGYKGVYFHRGKWRAQITQNGKCITIGKFATPEQAHEAYCQTALKLYQEFARLE